LTFCKASEDIVEDDVVASDVAPDPTSKAPAIITCTILFRDLDVIFMTTTTFDTRPPVR
jgi:hypothetical protein